MDAGWIAEARARIDARGELPLPVRHELRHLLADAVGGSAWARLEAGSARRVRQRWDVRFGGRSEPWDLLDDAVEARRSGANLMQADRRFADCWALLEDVHEGPDFRPTYAGFAAYAAARAAAYQPAPVGGGSELEIDVEDWDACFFASLAACGGAVWEEAQASDDAQRRAFWAWYLDEAARIGGAT